MLHYGLFTWKGNCCYGFAGVLIAVAINIQDKVSFLIPFIISGAQFKEAGYSKNITFDSGNYLNM